MDGILVDLLNAKWNAFVKSRFYRQFFLFCFYFVLSLISFTLRPGPAATSSTFPLLSPTEFPTTTSPNPDHILPNITSTVLSLLFEKIIDIAAFASNVKFPWNVTTARFDKLKLDIVANLTSIFASILTSSNVLSTDRSRNEIELLNYSYKPPAVPIIQHFYPKNDATPILAKDYPKITINETLLSINSTLFYGDDAFPTDSNKRNNWYVTGIKICFFLRVS